MHFSNFQNYLINNINFFVSALHRTSVCFGIQTYLLIIARRPDQVIINNNKKKIAC